MKLKIFLSLWLVTVMMACWSTKQDSQVGQGLTALGITNNTNDTVTGHLTLGASEYNVGSVEGIFGITQTGLQGSFILLPNDTLWYYGTDSTQFSGNISFFSPPINCPDTNIFPTGINLFEFTLNNSVIDTTQQETIDISCVAGCNVLGAFNMTGGGPWNAGPNYNNINLFFNDSLGKNEGKVGVYPYMCDGCVVSTSPPVCTKSYGPVKVQKQAICNVQRSCMLSGGKVVISVGAIDILK